MKKIRVIRYSLIALGVGLLVACSGADSRPDNAVVCEEPRSPMCTREYRPVCGVNDTGNQKTYGNGCDACANAEVVYHTLGACEADPAHTNRPGRPVDGE